MTAEFCSLAARPLLTAGLLRCGCGSGLPLMAVEPGSDPVVCDLFPLIRGRPARGFCLICWARVHGGPILSEATP